MNGKRVTVFYPWPDILDRNGGASLRAGHMIDFLGRVGCQVTVASPGREQTREGVVYRWYPPSRVSSLLRGPVAKAYKAVMALLSLGRSRGEDHMLWNHYEKRFDPAFRRFAAELVAESDAVILEYTFWGSPIAELCRRAGIPLAVTANDVLAFQVQTPWLRALTLRAEVQTLQAADMAICVSPGDQSVFRAHGVDCIVVPHGIDTKPLSEGSSAQARARIKEMVGVDVPAGHVCLFVGSFFAANFTAAGALRGLAEATREDGGSPIIFLVAGGCRKPEISDNFISFGRVTSEVLEALYHVADVVLVPLTSGTGASVKTIEAMARGKVVLGTSVGFRGYPVVPGHDCVVSDDLSDYPRLVRAILCDEAARASIEASARGFAAPYDFRTVFRPYADLLGLPTGKTGPGDLTEDPRTRSAPVGRLG